MKKIIISSFVVVIAVTVLLVLSSPKESNYSLHLVVDFWSDQDIDYPEKEFDFENITLNGKYVIPLAEDYDFLRKFKVVKISKSSITISTPIPLSDREHGIGFDSKIKKFIIKDGMSLSLGTLSMDAGEDYKFTLIKKE